MVGVRLSVPKLKKVDRLADALSCDRSGAIRWLIDYALDRWPASALLSRSGKGRGMAGEIVRAAADRMKAKFAADAVERARPADKVQAEIKALRAEEQAEERRASIADRLAKPKA